MEYRSEYLLRATVRETPIWTVGGEAVDPRSLPLSDRMLIALDDWAAFYDDVGGEIGDADVIDEFVSQGFKIAHAMRRELKGRTVHFEHPVSGERIRIELRRRR